MRSRTLVPFLLVLLALSQAVPAAAWWNQNWTKRVKLTLLNGGQPENLMSFPVLVRLDGNRVNYADTQDSGQDVRFVDADDSTILAHEIELWNESGSSFVWVRVPQVDASSNSDFIWMYYGNPVAADGQSASGVWDSDFKMVHHLQETSGTHFDSTSNGNNSVAIEITTQGSASGRIDGADQFSGTDDIEVASSASINVGATESMTLEAWIRTSNAAGGMVIVSKEDPAGGEYQLWVDAGNAKFWLHDGTIPVRADSTTNVANNAWRYVVGRWNEATSTAQVFVDGTSVGTASNAGLGALSGGRALRIGEEGDSDPEGGFNFSGTIDEVRLSKVARSDNWIRAQHLSMSDRFLSFGGPSTVGAMRVKSGSYTGNGIDDRRIFVGFQPDVVIVDMDEAVEVAPNEAVIRTSTMAGDASKDMDGASALTPNKIQSFDATGFTIGTHATVNEATRTYRWVAFRAAPGKLKLGSYVGNGIDNTSISGVGFQPEYVMVLPANASRASHRSSAMPGDITYPFASPGFADGIQALEADGFQVGLDPRVNASGVTYYYAAWNASPGEVAVGVYTGNGAATRDITGVGFFPEHVIVNRSDLAFRATQKPASSGINTDRSLVFESRLGEADNIEALLPDGFRVGGHSRVNSSTAPNDYYWVAFGPHSPKVNLRSIGDLANTYGTGTVSVTNGSPVVNGIGGTTWVTANRGRGDAITIPCGNPPACTGGFHYTIARVINQTSLELTDGYAGATSGSVTYLIRRQFGSPGTWEDCIDGGGTTCGLFPPVPSSNLVNDDRIEVGIVYKDVVYVAPLDSFVVRFNGSTTDAGHSITLTADGVNRHNGIPGAGVRFEATAASTGGNLIQVLSRFVTVEWIDLSVLGSGADAIEVSNSGISGNVTLRNNLIRNGSAGIQIQDALVDVDIYNNIMYSLTKEGVSVDLPIVGARIFNNTIFNTRQGLLADPSGSLACAPTCTYPMVLLRNNLVHTTSIVNYTVPGLNPLSSHNLSGPADATATTHSPAGGGQPSVSLAAVAFVDSVSAAKNLHLQGTSFAIDKAADLSGVFTFDVDGGARATPWDIGADDVLAGTRVELVTFEARGANQSVELHWETGSELDNLGFHLYRAVAESGPYQRITSRLVPGLGSSPEGARYRYVDSGLSNGSTYFYRLEDVETTGRTKLHGPVWATPTSASAPPSPVSPESLITFGRPEANGFRVVTRTARRLVLELTTEGFYAEPEDDGSVRLEIPGFEPLSGSPSVPVLRPWVEIPGGGEVRIASVRASSRESFSGLRPSGAETGGIEASAQGTVRARRMRGRHLETSGLVPSELARLVQVGFQGDSRKAQLELAPLRWDGAELVLARMLTVELELEGAVPRRARTRRASTETNVIARLVATEEGLYEVSYEGLFGQGRGRPASSLRLSRLGEPVAFHVEPTGSRFGPGSKLFFWSEGPRANPYGPDLVYELSSGTGGRAMDVGSAAPSGEVVPSHLATARYEENRYYQAGLLDAEDVWLWDLLLAPVTKSFPFQLQALAPGDSRLTVWLQGVSDLPPDPDHHVRIYVNGALYGEWSWNGKRGETVVLELPPGALLEGENRLEIENVGDTGAAYSMVMLDRFELVYPCWSFASEGRVEGQWSSSGASRIEGLGPAHVLDVTGTHPRWLTGARLSGDGALSFRVEQGHHYVAVSREAARRPAVLPPVPARLARETNRADYLVIGPREFASAAAPLIQYRSGQGLMARFVAIEDVYREFGFGETRPEAIREFLRYVYERWSVPRLRYVLLAGDATYDFKDYLKTGVRNQVPSLMVKTSYLWTASDPSLAAIRGDDILPDVAIGRLPAKSADELRGMVEKILAYERGDADLSDLLVLVADNPDRAGDFEANAAEIARGVLAGREVRRISVAQLGGGTRGEILTALDEGASLVSYIGHGGIHLWADENIFNTADVSSLLPQTQQPLLLTMNCLNGYFHFPYFDSLAEALVKAEGKGAIAAFSPSGLSLDAPAHRYHMALLDAIFRRGHRRLGDAVLAAQIAYAESGAFPELLSIYHLLGDPALSLK